MYMPFPIILPVVCPKYVACTIIKYFVSYRPSFNNFLLLFKKKLSKFLNQLDTVAFGKHYRSSCGVIHIWCSCEYLQQQDVAFWCTVKHSSMFMVMKDQYIAKIRKKKKSTSFIVQSWIKKSILESINHMFTSPDFAPQQVCLLFLVLAHCLDCPGS